MMLMVLTHNLAIILFVKELFYRACLSDPFNFFCGRKNFEIKLKNLIFQDRFDILLKIRLSGVVEQNYTVLYGKSQLNTITLEDELRDILLERDDIIGDRFDKLVKNCEILDIKGAQPADKVFR